MRRMFRRKRDPLGSIRGDLPLVALRLQGRVADCPLAWVDDRGDVFVAAGDDVAGIPDAWLLGRYALGVTAADIEADLRAMRDERARDWRFD